VVERCNILLQVTSKTQHHRISRPQKQVGLIVELQIEASLTALESQRVRCREHQCFHGGSQLRCWIKRGGLFRAPPVANSSATRGIYRSIENSCVEGNHSFRALIVTKDLHKNKDWESTSHVDIKTTMTLFLTLISVLCPCKRETPYCKCKSWISHICVTSAKLNLSCRFS